MVARQTANMARQPLSPMTDFRPMTANAIIATLRNGEDEDWDDRQRKYAVAVLHQAVANGDLSVGTVLWTAIIQLSRLARHTLAWCWRYLVGRDR